MSAGRQRENRLQGRFAAPKRKSYPPSPLSTDGGPSCASRDLFYTKTDYENEKSKGPVVLNDHPEMFRQWIEISMTDKGKSEIYFDPTFLSCEKADGFFASLHFPPHIKWEEREVVVGGERYPQPRLVHWIGPYEYKYSSVSLTPNFEWPDEVMEIREELTRRVPRIEEVKGGFNSVLLNQYRNEHDSVAWHSDNELSMGVQPFIASVSLGDKRRFQLKRKTSPRIPENPKKDADYVVHLDHGSLIIMNGALQDDWLHRVPKEAHSRKPRINLTFRTVYDLKS